MKIKKLILVLSIALIPATTASADYSYLEYWEIADFHSDITVHKNGTVEIKENILADFTNEAHRGLLRSIPTKYANGYNAHIFFKHAEKENDPTWTIKDYYDPYYLNIEIRTPNNQPTTEPAKFLIDYTAENVINFFPDHEELSWNINGNDFPVVNKKVSATVHLPENLEEKALNIICLTGNYGSTSENCKISKLDSRTIEFTTTQSLEPYEGMTIALGLPTNTIQKPNFYKKTAWILRENTGVVMIPLSFLVMLLLWFILGRDDQNVRNTIMPHYHAPENLSATETGVIIDEKVHPQDITSAILDYAVKGYIKITEIKKQKLIGEDSDYELELLKPYKTTKEFENAILKGIFESNIAGETKKISQLKNHFYTHIPVIEKSIIRQLILDGHFPHNPHHVRFYYSFGGSLVLFLLLFAGAIPITDINIAAIVASGIVVTIMSKYMPRKTKKGTEAYYKLKGLYEYINTAEKDRLKFQEKNNLIFEKLLPYAMAFGLIEKWTNAFEGLLKTPPGWFISSSLSGNSFSMYHFSRSLGRMSENIVQNISAVPGSKGSGGSWGGGSSFGGGGFSGGGFGGGGGRGL